MGNHSQPATLVALAQLRKGKIPKMPKFPSLHFNLEKEMHFKTEEDYKAWVATQEKGAIGGGLLTPQGGGRLCWSYSSHSCGFIF